MAIHNEKPQFGRSEEETRLYLDELEAKLRTMYKAAKADPEQAHRDATHILTRLGVIGENA